MNYKTYQTLKTGILSVFALGFLIVLFFNALGSYTQNTLVPCDADGDGCADDICCQSSNPAECGSGYPQIEPLGNNNDPFIGQQICVPTPIPSPTNTPDGPPDPPTNTLNEDITPTPTPTLTPSLEEPIEPSEFACQIVSWNSQQVYIREEPTTDSNGAGSIRYNQVLSSSGYVINESGEVWYVIAAGYVAGGVIQVSPACEEIGGESETVTIDTLDTTLGINLTYDSDFQERCPDVWDMAQQYPIYVQVALDEQVSCESAERFLIDAQRAIFSNSALDVSMFEACDVSIPQLVSVVNSLQHSNPAAFSSILDQLIPENSCNLAYAIVNGQPLPSYNEEEIENFSLIVCEPDMQNSHQEIILQQFGDLGISTDNLLYDDGCALIRSIGLVGSLSDIEKGLFNLLRSSCQKNANEAHQLVLYSLLIGADINTVSTQIADSDCSSDPRTIIDMSTNSVSPLPDICEVTLGELIRIPAMSWKQKLDIIQSSGATLYSNNNLIVNQCIGDTGQDVLDNLDLVIPEIEVSQSEVNYEEFEQSFNLIVANAELLRNRQAIYTATDQNDNSYAFLLTTGGVQEQLEWENQILYPALQPRSNSVAYIGQDNTRQNVIKIRALHQLEGRIVYEIPIPDGYEVAQYPMSWSPNNSNKLAYTLTNSQGQHSIFIHNIRLDSPPDLLIENAFAPVWSTWGSDQIMFTRELEDGRQSIFIVNSTGGTPTEITSPGEGLSCSNPTSAQSWQFIFQCETDTASSLYLYHPQLGVKEILTILDNNPIQPVYNPKLIQGTNFMTFDDGQIIYQCLIDIDSSEEQIECAQLEVFIDLEGGFVSNIQWGQ